MRSEKEAGDLHHNRWESLAGGLHHKRCRFDSSDSPHAPRERKAGVVDREAIHLA
jgi:hypothetical protein